MTKRQTKFTRRDVNDAKEVDRVTLISAVEPTALSKRVEGNAFQPWAAVKPAQFRRW